MTYFKTFRLFFILRTKYPEVADSRLGDLALCILRRHAISLWEGFILYLDMLNTNRTIAVKLGLHRDEFPFDTWQRCERFLGAAEC